MDEGYLGTFERPISVDARPGAERFVSERGFLAGVVFAMQDTPELACCKLSLNFG